MRQCIQDNTTVVSVRKHTYNMVQTQDNTTGIAPRRMLDFVGVDFARVDLVGFDFA